MVLQPEQIPGRERRQNMATAINNRERLPKLELQPNVPVTVALKFKGPRETDYGLMFTTSEGPLFLSLEEGSQLEHAIEEAGIRTGEPFLLTKLKFGRERGGGFSYRADRLNAGTNLPGISEIERQLAQSIIEAERKKAGASGNAPVTQTAIEKLPNTAPNDVRPSDSPITPTHARFLAVYMVAVDILSETKVYAQRKGMALEPRCEDVRALAATIIIDAKGGAR